MSKTRRGLSFVLCLVMVFSLFAGIPFKVLDLGTEANAVDSNTNPGDSEWVTAWHTSMLYLDQESDVKTAVEVLADYNERTFRTVIPMTIMGDKIRLTYSNEYAPDGQVLKIGEITLAKGDPNDVPALPDSSKMVKIRGERLKQIFQSAIGAGNAHMGNSYYQDKDILIVEPGKKIVSDAIDISELGLNTMDYMAVSTWAAVKGNEVLLNSQDGTGDSNGNIMDELVAAILDEFETDERTARGDAEEFIAKLKEINAVE